MNDRIVIILCDPAGDALVELYGPGVCGIVETRHTQVVYNISAPDDQHILFTQFLQLAADVIVFLGFDIGIEGHLNHRHVGFREHAFEHGPRSVIKPQSRSGLTSVFLIMRRTCSAKSGAPGAS